MPGIGNKYFRIDPFPKDSRIVFLAYVGTEVNDQGVDHEIWKVVAKRWAYVDQLRGWETHRDNEVYTEHYSVFRINYDFDFHPTVDMVIYYDHHIYDIQYLNNIRGENNEVEMQTMRRVMTHGAIQNGENLLNGSKPTGEGILNGGTG